MSDRGHRKTLVGTVVSDKMQKTVVVQVERLTMDQRFKKFVRRRKKYKAHDEAGQCRVGDKVMIVETRPLSRDKRWRVLKMVEKAL
ncbi:MAG: 30S ribosomal protein S17 [Thermodesulfobacteriota bacterium]